jgi:hypothetical protein
LNFLGLFDSPTIIILGIVIIVALVAIFSSLKPSPKRVIEDIEKILKDNNIDYTITLSDDKNYTFDLTINNVTYTTLVLPIEKFAEVTINNFNTWEMHYGAGDKPGKAQPFKTKIVEIPGFMNVEKENKLVIIQPNAKQIVYWKNENEIVDVLPTNKVYNVNVVNVSDLPKLFIRENK